MKFKPGFIPIPIIAAIAALIVTATATIFGQIAQEGRPLETVGQTINLTALAGCDGTTPNVGLFWNQIPGETDYLVFRVVDGGFQYLDRTTAGVYKDSSLTPGASYTYQVTAGTSRRASNQTTVTALTSCSQTGQPPQPTPTPTPAPAQPIPTPTPTPAPTADTLTIPQNPLPAGTVGQDYAGPSAWVFFVFSQQQNRYLTTTETTITVTGFLPPGITFNDTLDAIDGIPTAAGTYAFTITARGPSGAFAQKSTSITVIQDQQGSVVLPTPTPSPTPAPQGQVNNPPRAVTITGPTAGTVGQTLTYSLRAIDPDGDRLIYRACWDKNGDGAIDQTSEKDCQETDTVRAAWSVAGTFLLYAIAFDGREYGQWAWVTVTISTTTPTQPSPTPISLPTLDPKKILEICRSANYPIVVAKSPANPKEFIFSTPNELQTPVTVEGIIGGTTANILSGRPEITRLGPFDWHPNVDTGWSIIQRFDIVPEVVGMGMLSYNKMTNQILSGCGFWPAIPGPSASPTPVGRPTQPPANFNLQAPTPGAAAVAANPSFDWQDAQGTATYWIYLGQEGQGWYWTKQVATSTASWDQGNGWQTCPGCPARDKPLNLPQGQWQWWVAAENALGTTWANLAISQASFTFTVGTAGGIPSPSPSPSPSPTPSPSPGPGLKPDLAIANTAVLTATPQPGEQVSVVVTIINKGTAPATNFYNAMAIGQVSVFCGSQFSTPDFVENLAPGATTKVTFSVVAPNNPYETTTLQVYADSTCAVDELDETNNSQYVTFKTGERGPTVSPTYPTPPVGPSPTGSPTTNRPPNTPAKPSGPTTGKVGEKLGFFTSTTDPDNNPIRYQADLSAGRFVDFSHTSSSSQTFFFTVTWLSPGTYNLRVKAVDTHGAESGWSEPLTITITGTTASCTTVRNNGDPAKKLDVTFVPLAYSLNEMAKFAADVDEQIKYLLYYQPFSQKTHLINFYRVDSVEFGGPGDPVQTKQSPWTFFSLVGDVCPSDLIIAIGNFPNANAWGQIDGGVAFVSRLHEQYHIGHEVGHAYGGFWHEHVEQSNDAHPDSTPPINCSASKDSPPWRGITGTKIGLRGCNAPNWYRASEASIMSYASIGPPRTDWFDPWNIKLLSDKLRVYE